MHLLLPLLASLLFVCGLILIKRTNAAGLGPITTLFLTNEFSAVIFSVLWFFGGPSQPWWLLWQPATIAFLFIAGLVFTFLAIQLGDVSIATPLFGVKVLLVAIILTFVGQERLPLGVWYAAALATFGIALIQWTGRSHPRRVLLTVSLALSAASCYATFDVLVQRWAPAWGAGRFLPIVYWIVGIASLPLIPWVNWEKLGEPRVRRLVVAGSLLLALQAVCIVVAVAVFGDAARINVVYALRGLWGVGLAWGAAKIWGGAEGELGRGVMPMRAAGASLLTIAVVLAILSRPA